MSLFTKKRKLARKEREERQKRLSEGFDKIERSLNKMVTIMEDILKDHPEYEELSEEDKTKIYIEYYKKYEKDTKSKSKIFDF